MLKTYWDARPINHLDKQLGNRLDGVPLAECSGQLAPISIFDFPHTIGLGSA